MDLNLELIEQENQQYMNEKLKSIITPMVAQILIRRPKNVRTFMLEWLKKTYNHPGPEKSVAETPKGEEVGEKSVHDVLVA